MEVDKQTEEKTENGIGEEQSRKKEKSEAWLGGCIEDRGEGGNEMKMMYELDDADKQVDMMAQKRKEVEIWDRRKIT